ncbi:hypothetical protein RJ639_011276 [Escallonia herrerae]|uniref:BZIP domain-containing protein n=1 Tax=Escallonia herrerae TaxID=1293975 RepID=A0AA88VMC9_9ASTE|nr:hypothetical protein RJ639_011276 [Escallonia herrerae]
MGASSWSMQIQNSSSQEDLQQMMDQRKRKRMVSNRESARRSRMRKQKHLDDLAKHVDQLVNENSQIVTSLNVTTELYLNIDAENSVLRAQLYELTHRLRSLNEIITCLDLTSCFFDTETDEDASMNMRGDEFLSPWNLLPVNQPIMGTADMLIMH